MNLTKEKKVKTSKQLLWIGIGGIVMFFGGLTSAYIVRKAEGNWHDFSIPNWFWISTITIVVSSFILIITQKRIKQNQVIDKHLFAVLIMGIFFLFCQFKGWGVLIADNVYFTGEGSNPSGSFFYVLTVTHLAHLIGGLIALLVTAINAVRGKYSSDNFLGLELTSIYWHFLGLLWIYLFFFIKYL